jgi:hypothetical protein
MMAGVWRSNKGAGHQSFCRRPSGSNRKIANREMVASLDSRRLADSRCMFHAAIAFAQGCNPDHFTTFADKNVNDLTHLRV